MAKTDLPYDLAAVRRLLLDAFTDKDLRPFLQDCPTFRPILARLSAQEGLAGIVEEVIDYCSTHLLFDHLLDAVREANPAQYARHEPQLRASGADEIALKLLKPGSILLGGRYRILRHIARGGFGSVYLAEDTLLREQVAIKELIPALVGDEDALKRFLVEAKAMMQLSHPHIVRIRDVFEAGNNYYMVMEYAPGGSLEDLCKMRKALSVDDAVRILAEVCQGLSYAHARGVVHCDMKPSNVLLAADGSAKVTDFGVAHVSDQVVTRSWITPGGFAGGTLPYMSPEQTDGIRDDPRIDIYALGAILYRLLTGRMYLDFDQRDTPRAQSDNVQRIISQEPVPPSSHNRRMPAWLEAVILKALAKQPEDRYASADELRSALLDLPSEQPTPRATPVSRPALVSRPTLADRLRRLPAWVWPAAGGVALLAIVLLIVIPPDLPGGGLTLTPTVTPTSAQAIVSTPSPTPAPTPSACGNHILWVDDCDPRLDPEFCNESDSLDTLGQFYDAIGSAGATLTYAVPVSASDLNTYDVVIANFCGPADDSTRDFLRSYLSAGGSVVVLGDNFCLGVELEGGWASSAEAASALTVDWGITFTADDDVEIQWSDSVSPHPLTAGVETIYAYRHAYLDVQTPSQTVVSMGGRPFVAVYDGEGTLVAIPQVGFHWRAEQESDNFVLWRNMLSWLIAQSCTK